MSSSIYYILEISQFAVIVLIGISLISFLLYHVSNNFKKKYINIYGFFTSLDDISLVMLSSAILKEISLIYCVFNTSRLSMIYLYVFLIISFTYAFFSFNVWIFLKEFVISAIEYLIIYFFSLLSSFLVDVKYSKIVVLYIYILSAILVSCSIYFFARNLSYIISKDSHVRRNMIGKNR